MIEKWPIKIKKGFTLIELIVVIAILGILVLLAAPNFLGKTQDAEHVKIMTDSKNIEDASVMYHLENEDWPRLTDDPYTADELKLFASDFNDKTGKEITLDPNGSYYNIDYDELSQYIKAPDNKKDYILQNPVGKVFHMENLTEAGENRVDYDTEADESEDPAEETLYEFTTAGATGRLGPTKEDLDKAYEGTNLEGIIISESGIQQFTVPETGTYKIETSGAQGGGKNGGYGAKMKGEFQLEKGEILKILVGQKGASNLANVAPGGGGTFVIGFPYKKDDSILVISGGGGGSLLGDFSNKHASIGKDGLEGHDFTHSLSPGGSSGLGGSTTARGSGGGGFLGNGLNHKSLGTKFGVGGESFVNGGRGAKISSSGVDGSFGGGGYSMGTVIKGFGGGGGYSGGSSSSFDGENEKIKYSGGGGGSYNSGENQENSVGNTGDGKVIITYLGK